MGLSQSISRERIGGMAKILVFGLHDGICILKNGSSLFCARCQLHCFLPCSTFLFYCVIIPDLLLCTS
jgi:hypothetical protein